MECAWEYIWNKRYPKPDTEFFPEVWYQESFFRVLWRKKWQIRSYKAKYDGLPYRGLELGFVRFYWGERGEWKDIIRMREN